MEVKKTVNASAKDIYCFLLSALKSDYEAALGRTAQASALQEGLQFHKKFGKNQANQAHVRVTVLKPNKEYGLAFRSSRGTQWLRYQIEEKDDRSCHIVYTEEFSPEGKLNTWNYKLLMPFMRRSLEQRMALQIEKLAEFAKNKEVMSHE
ncbi:DUF3284 domain-containing protein [Streptococcus merionis]|uniref:DUF3284 domain-containing protein n=1 Tax=Streptococcus merionis TaxID=400065 RepID=UPI0026EE4904|nr:DUF3284 domain-containing protein [Streptococcus merionis]